MGAQVDRYFSTRTSLLGDLYDFLTQSGRFLTRPLRGPLHNGIAVSPELPHLAVEERRPGSPSRARDRQLQFQVLYTRLKATAAALSHATAMARELNASVTIVATPVVPYPLPLTEPPVPVDFLHRTLWTLVSDVDLDVTVQIHLCRDRGDALAKVLSRESMVLLGASGPRWWPNLERRLARTLRRAGLAVFLIESL